MPDDFGGSYYKGIMDRYRVYSTLNSPENVNKNFVQRILKPKDYPKMSWDAPVRKPYESELDYFKKNPAVSGMADFSSGSVVMSPYSKLSENEKEFVVRNEKARLFMRESGMSPEFKLTQEQQRLFKDYGGGDELAQRETIVGRILSGDPSAGGVTKEQSDFAEQISKRMKGTEMSHIMSWGTAGGKSIVYPEVIYNKETKKLQRLGRDEAMDRALETGEYISFNDPNDADWFSKNYKLAWE